MRLDRLIFLCLIVFLALNGLVVPNEIVKAAPLLYVEVNPNNAGSVGEYRIYGSYSEYSNIFFLDVYFSEFSSFRLPQIPDGSVLVNSSYIQSGYFSRDTKGRVMAKLNLQKAINKGENVEIIFKKEAGLINPYVPAACYKVEVVLLNNANVEVGSLLSNNYRIDSSCVQNLVVKVTPPVRNLPAEYSLSFFTGVMGNIRARKDEIRVEFPEGTKIPSLSEEEIMVNNNNPFAVYKSGENQLRIYTTFDIPANSKVEVVFKKELGIITYSSGIKVIKVSTSVEPDWVESEPYEIFEPEIQNLLITLEPNSVALNPEINIFFKTSPVGLLIKGSKIYVEFPQGFTLPYDVDSKNVFVNGISTLATISGNVFEIISQDDIKPLSDVEVKIPKDFGITNPALFGDYYINVWTDSDSFKSSSKVYIKKSTVSEVLLSPLYSGFNSANEFNISFKTGPVYTLEGANDRIVIKFDEGFTLPDAPAQNLITVNGMASTNVVEDVYSIYYITTPVDIQPGSLVEVKIPETFGIKNPVNLGEYGVKVSTTKEAEEVESNKIKITPLPVVEFTVEPQAPDGQNGYYKTVPEIRLSTSNGVKVFYKVDDGEFAEFTASFKIDEGTHTVYAYAMDDGGNKGDTIKKEFSVDNTPPKITFDNTNSDPYFKGSSGKLTGNVSESCTLKINEVILELTDDLHFSIELNVDEGMPIAIFARDPAGNTATLLLTAHIDSIPPVITFISKVNRVQGLGVNSVETTEPTYTIQVKLDEKGKVFIDSNEMFFDGQTFSYTVSLADGENQFIIKGVDFAGNETAETLLIKKINEKTITLQIGSNLASVGSETVELDAPPFIEKGFTLVPLRFISEAFGASVDWNDALKVITINYRTLTIQLQIGSNVVLVGTEFKKLDVPPKIVNGRTFVPIRFISETFGAEVSWDGGTKTVTIVYKP